MSGATVGIGLACFAASGLDWLEHQQQLMEARASRRAEALAASPPIVDLFANRLVRKNSKVINEAYTFQGGPPLGEGSFGVVLKAVHNRSGVERAVKRIEKGAQQPSPLQEVELLRAMDHPHVCRLVEYFETPRHFWLVTELCRGEELCNRLLDRPGGLPETDVVRLLRQMLRATLHCHRNSVVHRDLKPENFLVAPGEVVKLIDFGSAVRLGTTMEAPTDAGTLLYMSPQMLSGKPASQADDVWSLGVILHILLTGRFPFSTNDDARFQELVDGGMLQQDVEQRLQMMQCSQSAHDLACKLLAFDPLKRITLEAALQHPFLRVQDEDTQKIDIAQLRELCARFTQNGRLRRLALAMLARLDDSEEADRVKATFLALDGGDGPNVPSAGVPASVPCLGRWVRGFQGHSNPQAMSYTSFAAATFDASGDSGSQQVCHAVFDLLDADHDGLVSADDLCRRLDVSMEEAADMMKEALRDIGSSPHRKPHMDFKDFAHLMTPRSAAAIA